MASKFFFPRTCSISLRLFQREGDFGNIEPKMKVKLKSSNGKRLSAQMIRQQILPIQSVMRE